MSGASTISRSRSGATRRVHRQRRAAVDRRQHPASGPAGSTEYGRAFATALAASLLFTVAALALAVIDARRTTTRGR